MAITQVMNMGPNTPVFTFLVKRCESPFYYKHFLPLGTQHGHLYKAPSEHMAKHH